MQPATLRATDKVQRDIEEALKSAGLFYDRRKNFYKNEGKPAEKIISIPLMAQSVMSMILRRPDSARARPSSLIKDNSIYSDIFSEDYPIGLYTNAAALIKIVDRGLRSRSEMKPRDRTNVRFFVLFWLTAKLTGKPVPKPDDVAKLDARSIDEAEVESAADEVWKLYEMLGGGDQVAKGPDLRKAVAGEVLAQLTALYRQNREAKEAGS